MTIKKVLVPLLDSPGDENAILHAVEVARPLGAHVTAMFPGGYLSELFQADAVPHPRIKPRLPAEARAQLGALTDAAREAFDAIVAKHGLAVRDDAAKRQGGTVSFETWRGTVEAAVQEAAVYHDLVLFHRDDRDRADDSFGFSAMKSALQDCGRPMLVAAGEPGRGCGTRIAIGWNGSIEGAHAVSAAMPLLTAAKSVHILTIATQKTAGEQAEKLQAYLAWHGVGAEVRTAEAGAAPVGVALLGMVDAVGADLFVLGGYTHSRIRQTILGGVTHVVMQEARVPVLFSQ